VVRDAGASVPPLPPPLLLLLLPMHDVRRDSSSLRIYLWTGSGRGCTEATGDISPNRNTNENDKTAVSVTILRAGDRN